MTSAAVQQAAPGDIHDAELRRRVSAPGEGTRVALAVDLARNREARQRRWAVPWAERPSAP